MLCDTFIGREILHMLGGPYIYLVFFILLEWMYRQNWYKKVLPRPKAWVTFILPGLPLNLFLGVFEIMNAGQTDSQYPWWKSYVDIAVWNIFQYTTAYVLYRLTPRLGEIVAEIRELRSKGRLA